MDFFNQKYFTLKSSTKFPMYPDTSINLEFDRVWFSKIDFKFPNGNFKFEHYGKWPENTFDMEYKGTFTING